MTVNIRSIPATMVAAVATLSMAMLPVLSWADASAPHAVRAHKARPKPHVRHRIVRAKPVAKPMAQPVETVQQAPVPQPMPEPVAPPAPQVVAAPEPTPQAAPAQQLAVAKRSRGFPILAVLAGAAVLAGIVIASDNKSTSP